jgi:hypothetical protein
MAISRHVQYLFLSPGKSKKKISIKKIQINPRVIEVINRCKAVMRPWLSPKGTPFGPELIGPVQNLVSRIT